MVENEFPAQTREVVATFASRDSFEGAVAALRSAGFEHADLSALATHEAIEAASSEKTSWREVFNAFVNEARYENPLVASGLIFLAGGPVTAAVAGVIGAAVGGLAVKDVVDEVVARPHTEQFARALEAGGAVLWVRIDAPEREQAATRVLRESGGENIHTVHRSRDPSA